MNIRYANGAAFFTVVGMPGKLLRFLRVVDKLARGPMLKELSFQENSALREFCDGFPTALKKEIEGGKDGSTKT